MNVIGNRLTHWPRLHVGSEPAVHATEPGCDEAIVSRSGCVLTRCATPGEMVASKLAASGFAVGNVM